MPRRPMLVLDTQPDRAREFYDRIRVHGSIRYFGSLSSLLGSLDHQTGSPVILVDVAFASKLPPDQIALIRELRQHACVGLLTDTYLEDYLDDLKRIGIYQVAVKTRSFAEHLFHEFLACIENPKNGFGLMNYMQQTCEVHRKTAKNLDEKHICINAVIDHFATNGYDVHELYDVRLVLEELLNNAFFHAFKNAAGKDKYHITDFTAFSPGEEVTVEFASSAITAGFSVSDSAGSLSLSTVFHKLERQFTRDGLFDESGRGLYLCRILSSVSIINIDETHQTQIIALFDERRRLKEPKPFIINYVPSTEPVEAGLDPELD